MPRFIITTSEKNLEKLDKLSRCWGLSTRPQAFSKMLEKIEAVECPHCHEIAATFDELIAADEHGITIVCWNCRKQFQYYP